MTKIKETKSIGGHRLVQARTINSMYADGKIELEDKQGERYRIDVSELLKLIQKKNFTATKKAKYFHLTIEEDIPM